MEDAVKLSTQRGDCFPCSNVCVWSTIVIQKENIIDLVPSDNHLFGLMKEGISSKFASDEEVKTAVRKWLKEQSTKVYEARISALIRK